MTFVLKKTNRKGRKLLARVTNLNVGGGKYFSMKENKDAHAILAVPHSVEFDIPNSYKGMQTVSHDITMDAWVFRSAADLKNKTPHVLSNVVWSANKGIANEFDKHIGDLIGPFVVRKNERGFWTYVTVTEKDSAFADANAYADELYEQLEAAAAGGGQGVMPMPSFDA